MKVNLSLEVYTVFLARDSIYAIARYMPSPVRLSRCLSHGWISQRRLQLGSRNLHHRVAPCFLTYNFTAKFQREDRERGRRIREGYEKCKMRHFQPTAGIVLRFTRGRCRALPFALARLSCFLTHSGSFVEKLVIH